MAPSRSDILRCPAKLNLALSVGPPVDTPAGRRHPIASWMVAISFADRLALERLPAGPSRFDRAFLADAPVPARIDWPPARDLCVRAHALLEEHVGQPLPVSLRLGKRIPPGAGLAGGSGNAAGTMVGLDHLFGLGLDAAVLTDLAARLGSDVAFMVSAMLGRRSALVTGLGETVEPLALRRPLHVVLIFPPFACGTADVYRAFDDLLPGLPSGPRPDSQRIRTLAQCVPLPADGLFNDLTEPACRIRPELGPLMRQVKDGLGLPVHLTGSGSTLFVVAPGEAEAMALAGRATAITGMPARVANTLAPSAG